MGNFRKSILLLLVILGVSATTGLAQVDVSVSLGIMKNYVAIEQIPERGAAGTIIANKGNGDPVFSVQASMPIKDKLHLQAGLRTMFKTYVYNLRFEYANQFTFEDKWMSWGNSVELPVHVVYDVPSPVLGRQLKLIGGVCFSRNTIYELSDSYSLKFTTREPYSFAHVFDTELFSRKAFLTPALEAGFELTPLFFRNFSLRAIYHFDLIPTFGSVIYHNNFYITSSGQSFQDYPEGTMKAKRTSYLMGQLNYRLPFWDKKKPSNPKFKQKSTSQKRKKLKY
ncbi:hypothetical protein I5M27_00190 [Adhaeribacter sp. BT258]|uniref:Outer membrane protein beta-barrel domain-containing protein n=1 Tax=Adhaeribacter terrigena TaxID=2793070 RepID=A0ABS1BW95_9BACT|nr:hypothetical protein [Adhaeribacter terrigena]MBK0401382.1 hypothetical protein [Adhaeribacter terrigena]